ncbi:MAG: AMP-binding protein, partial [Bacillota bacterium]
MKSFAEYIIPRAVNDPKGTMIVDKNATRVTTSEELISLAYQIANYTKTLPNHGRVVCTLPRSMEYVAAIIGTNLIGTGLAMLSHLEPEARLEMILDDLGTEINIDEAFIEQAKKASNAPVAPVGTLETEALYFFTSGSTGTPKGVIYTNNTVISSLTRTGAAFFLDRDNLIYCSIVPFNFCLSIGELASVLAVEKGCVHLPTDEVRINPVELTKYINTHKITQTFLPPQLCMAMTGDMPSLLAIAVGSEKVVNIGPRSYQMQNGYAMTETAAVDTIFLIDKPYENTPIGKPLSGMEVYLLDENGNESEEGEIYVAGGVAKGYLNLPEETAKTFVPNPFSKGEHDKIMVRTGDLGRRLEDGNILYINRLDWMLKIDGQRIEPGEIEVVCAKMPKIQKIFIKGFVNDRSQTYLCAFYVEKEPFQKEELRKHIEENLPYYMQPKYLVKMDSVPLNANGKVNRLAMKSPEDNIITTVYKAPEGECEKKICQAFERIFSVKQVGRDDDFFRLGGDSIKTTLLLRDLDYPNLKNTDILLGKTPKGIAEIVEKQMEESAIYENFPDESDLHTSPLTDNQMGIYLECISRPNSLAYNIPFFFEFEKNVCADAEALKKMVDECLMAHKALFTKIVQTEQGVVMTLGDVVPVCEVRKGKEEEIAQTIEDFVRPFDLSVAPLCRAMIVETDAKLYLMIDAHHIVFDGTSLILFEEELGNQLQGKAIEPETISPFHLYELEQREKASEQYQEDKAYFDGILAGVEVDSELLPDHKIDGEVDFIKETQDEFYETIRHNKMSFVNIVEEYGVMPTVKFVYQGSGFNEITLPNGSIPLNAVENPHAIGALNCIVIKKDSGYTIVINYRSDLYDESTIARFTKLYERVLKAFSQDAKLQDIEMIEETDSVIYEAGNDTNIDFDESQT